MSHHRTFLLCPNKGSTTGAQWHKGLGMYIRCAACNAARREASDAGLALTDANG